MSVPGGPKSRSEGSVRWTGKSLNDVHPHALPANEAGASDALPNSSVAPGLQTNFRGDSPQSRDPGSDASETGLRVKRNKPVKWSVEEDRRLREAVSKFDEARWKDIAQAVETRNHVQCLQRWKKVLKPGLVKGQWSSVEDERLVSLVERGFRNWGQVASFMEGRTSKQCRERWCHHLDPAVRKGGYTAEEDDLIVFLQSEVGNRWADIAKRLTGRTENAVKIRWKALNRRQREARNKAAAVAAHGPQPRPSLSSRTGTREGTKTAARIAARKTLAAHHASSNSEDETTDMTSEDGTASAGSRRKAANRSAANAARRSVKDKISTTMRTPPPKRPSSPARKSPPTQGSGLGSKSEATKVQSIAAEDTAPRSAVDARLARPEDEVKATRASDLGLHRLYAALQAMDWQTTIDNNDSEPAMRPRGTELKGAESVKDTATRLEGKLNGDDASQVVGKRHSRNSSSIEASTSSSTRSASLSPLRSLAPAKKPGGLPAVPRRTSSVPTYDRDVYRKDAMSVPVAEFSEGAKIWIGANHTPSVRAAGSTTYSARDGRRPDRPYGPYYEATDTSPKSAFDSSNRGEDAGRARSCESIPMTSEPATAERATHGQMVADWRTRETRAGKRIHCVAEIGGKHARYSDFDDNVQSMSQPPCKRTRSPPRSLEVMAQAAARAEATAIPSDVSTVLVSGGHC